LFNECEIPEGMTHDWIKEKEKLCKFMDSIEDRAANKIFIFENDVGMGLCKWFLQTFIEGVPIV